MVTRSGFSLQSVYSAFVGLALVSMMALYFTLVRKDRQSSACNSRPFESDMSTRSIPVSKGSAIGEMLGRWPEREGSDGVISQEIEHSVITVCGLEDSGCTE